MKTPFPHLLWWLCAGLLLLSPLLAQAQPLRPAPASLDRLVAQALAEHPQPLELSLWLGGPQGPPFYQRAAEVPRPTASSIKTAYLLDLFVAQEPALDQVPPGAAAILAQEDHPAWQPFSPKVRSDIFTALRGATARRLGAIMMGSAPASNAAYNGAANLITALAGGPLALSQRIHQRDPAFAGITARRYMLARRDVTGDNEATAAALAAVLQRVASGTAAGLAPATQQAMLGVMVQKTHPRLGAHYRKDGDLDTDPMVQVRSGFFSGGLVYVVMLMQRSPGAQPRAEANRQLEARANHLTQQLVTACSASQ